MKKHKEYLCIICNHNPVKCPTSLCDKCRDDDVEIGAVAIGRTKHDSQWKWIGRS